METARIAQIIDEMGTLLEIKGENPFRCRAYHTAAQSLGNLPADLRDMIADGSLKEVPGIGETMYAKIVQLATTGQLASYDELKRSMPPGLVALLRIPGLGPKKIKTLHEELKIDSLADLRGGPVRQDCQDEGIRREDPGEYRCRDRIRREGGRANLAEHRPAVGGADRGAVEESR